MSISPTQEMKKARVKRVFPLYLAIIVVAVTACLLDIFVLDWSMRVYQYGIPGFVLVEACLLLCMYPSRPLKIVLRVVASLAALSLLLSLAGFSLIG